MSCIEFAFGSHGLRLEMGRGHSCVWLTGLGLSMSLLVGGCSNPVAPGSAPSAMQTAPRVVETPPLAASAPDTGHAPTAAGGVAASGLPPPKPVRTHEDLRLQAAQRLVAANPDITYMGQVPDELLAIPVLEVELYRDGRVKHVTVLRVPTQAKDTVEIAIAAVHKAAPYGDLSRLPEPRKFTETFLFDDDRRFKPRTLDN